MTSRIRRIVAQHGIDNLLFLVPLRPLRKILFIQYTSSSDEPILVPCKLVEKRYKISDGYKLEVQPIEDYEKVFGSRTFYQSDFYHLIDDAVIKQFVKKQ